jgi:hypothetical protein
MPNETDVLPDEEVAAQFPIERLAESIAQKKSTIRPPRQNPNCLRMATFPLLYGKSSMTWTGDSRNSAKICAACTKKTTVGTLAFAMLRYPIHSPNGDCHEQAEARNQRHCA